MSSQTLERLRAGDYVGVKKLKLSNDNLDSFPLEILSLHSTLEILDLSNNPNLTSLPTSISRLHNLKIAFFSDCSFKTFPSQLALCRSLEMVAFKNNGMTTIAEDSLPRKLRWLILTGNKIDELPRSIGECARLEKCMLAGNRLTSLPDEMRMCRKLGLLRLSCNRFERVPEWIWELPELAFFSCAGNPCLDVHSARSVKANEEEVLRAEITIKNDELENIPWRDLTVQHLLGKGASGIISQGLWKRSSPRLPHTFQDSGYSTPAVTASHEVAIKIFHGTLTSDGSPLDELKSCIAVGAHENVISSLGTITSHPANERGLVLELIPKHYINLGLPPNFDTCTRDNFAGDVKGKIDATKCMKILRGIAEAAAHLHSRGVAHGDLYAHNILVDLEAGHAVLGDFGAATLYRNLCTIQDAISEEEARKVGGRYEKLEVLAFGHLVEDLVGCVDWNGEADEQILGTLTLLWRASTCPIVEKRIGFGNALEFLRRHEL